MANVAGGIGNWIEVRYCSQIAGRYAANVARMYDSELGKWLEERLAHSKAPILITEIHIIRIELSRLMQERLEKASQ